LLEKNQFRTPHPSWGVFIDEYVNLYVDFALLEERVQGNLPAIEGIRIVKERKPAGE
jgi:hypothetical protein